MRHIKYILIIIINKHNKIFLHLLLQKINLIQIFYSILFN
jgi:hypothetical protein